ncbi:MAG: potassium channel family protein [Planctomycetota bacterium]
MGSAPADPTAPATDGHRPVRSRPAVGGQYVSLLLSLLLLVLLLPLVGGEERVLGLRLVGFCEFAILVAAVFSVSRQRRIRLIALILAVPPFVTTGVSTASDNAMLLAANSILLALFFGFIACLVLRDVLTAHHVTGDKIVGAICVYLLMGIIWALLYSLIDILHPGSLQMAQDASELPARIRFATIMYYSFVTLSTVGYGDIVPAAPITQTLAWMEAVTGQLYIAVLIARLVAIHITETHGSWRERDA